MCYMLRENNLNPSYGREVWEDPAESDMPETREMPSGYFRSRKYAA